MNDYEKGLKKLGLVGYHLTVDGPQDWFPDLRHDPAFAWGVLEALHLARRFHWESGISVDLWDGDNNEDDLGKRLYVAVCKLGNQSNEM